MDFRLPEEIQMLRSTIRKFVEKECRPLEQQLCNTNPDWVELPEEEHKRISDKLKDNGLWALTTPTELGGGGVGPLGMAVAQEEKSKTTIGTAHHSPFGGEPPGILYNAKDVQVDKYLLPVIRGEKRSAMANTEPGAGSDAAAIQTTATKEGDNWVINGTKLFSTLADRADFLFVTAVTDKEKRGRGGITMFLVDANTDGFKVNRKVPVIRPQYSTELIFDNVIVPNSQVLGEIGEGFQLFKEWAAYGRIKMAATCLGMAQRALDMSIRYAKQRETFGKALSTRQAVQWMLVDSAVDIKTARLLTYETAWKLERGEDVIEEASMCKLHATEMAFKVLDRSIQIHGGMGLTKELPLERWFRDIRVMRIVEGATEIQKFIIARKMLR
ncbi:acyl-CoA dehydrogenase family protein [Oceanobacillus halophilus]|uniref:Medium-chain specific acyl-CoA dehydrogenase, mitochondrial n=1 Tax=Oceanobacillus halophilus TaxID=930130 RepID=A0A495A7D8_9BACI|nr:acyl-CoA dehydrogenase family protein [Oceanobacillus halophilus]RKQ35722.1 acyl-CoA dehydrogenase [Oceanobacillus halophilus]